MKKAQIYNLIIVDESGSMSLLHRATLTGINETLNTIRQAQKDYADTQEHWLTLVLFDTRGGIRTVIDCQPIAQVGEFTDYSPCGATPLYDAMGMSLTSLQARIRGNVDASAVVTVLTDGLENASREWNATRLRTLIEQLKAEGWSFAYMGSAHNVKDVTQLLSIEHAVEFDHSDRGTGSSWGYESGNRRAYYRKMSEAYSHGSMSRDELMRRKRQFANEYAGKRVTPAHITHLEPNEVFVFGSNAEGHHGGGAAAFAMHHFGAVWGQGEGLQGQSYALPTMGGLTALSEAVGRFAQYAEAHPQLRFLVTAVGCGVAGYPVSDIAPLFRNCINLENVTLPAEFWKELGLKMI